MSKILSKILKVASSVMIGIVVILAVLMVGLRLFGFQIYSVLSPSMEPTYPTGSLIYVREVDTGTLEAGDVITFRLTDNTTATHRIDEVLIENGQRRFRTKGDNNKTVDAVPIEDDTVIGSPVFSIPLLGYLAVYVQNPPGIYVAIVVGAALIMLAVIADILGEEDEPEKQPRRARKIPSHKKSKESEETP